jgi:hypothetical protein
VLALAAAAVLLRLPFLGAPEGADEGGYLAIARQWHGAGPSLYGQYWVDRPPLLITLFQVGSALGGLTALRVLAALAAGLAVLGVAEASRRIAGPRAAIASAAVAAALFVSPQLGTVQVNGELLAAPFVAWSIALFLRAPGLRVVRPSPRAGGGLAAFGAGVLAAAALLVKQNMADPLVFGVVTALVLWRARATHVRREAVDAAGGFVTGLVLIGTWTVIRGASLAGVFDAVYPFRVRAAAVLATMPDQGQAHRFGVFLTAWATSGVPLVLAVFVWAVLRGRLRGPEVWGLGALLVWATTSVLVSGGFWDHYLVELIVPVSIAGGLVVASGPARALPGTAPARPGTAPAGAGARPSRRAGLLAGLAAAAVVVVALTHWALAWGTTMPDRGVGPGTAIGTVAARGDTVVSVVGDAELVDASGLRSPYPFLWTLPAQVDDPHLSRLSAVLAGPDAPTWLVVWDRPSFPAAVRERLAAVVAAHYRAVDVVCGQPVLLRDGVTRAAPPPEPCHGRVAAVPHW